MCAAQAAPEEAVGQERGADRQVQRDCGTTPGAEPFGAAGQQDRQHGQPRRAEHRAEHRGRLMTSGDERAADQRVDRVAQPGQAGKQHARAIHRAAVAGNCWRQHQASAAEHGGGGGSGPPGSRPSLAGGPGQQAREHRRAAPRGHGGHGDAGACHGRVEGDRVPGHGQRAEGEQPPLAAGSRGQHRARAAAGEQQQQAASGQAGRADGRGRRPGRGKGAGGPGGTPQRGRGEDGGLSGQRGPVCSQPGKARGTGGAERAGCRAGTFGNQGRGLLGHCRELRHSNTSGTGLEIGRTSMPTAARGRARITRRQAVRAGKWPAAKWPAAECARSGARWRQDDVPVRVHPLMVTEPARRSAGPRPAAGPAGCSRSAGDLPDSAVPG